MDKIDNELIDPIVEPGGEKAHRVAQSYDWRSAHLGRCWRRDFQLSHRHANE